MEIVTRAEALERGLTRYFTGKPCKNGHLSERIVSNKTCSICSSIAKSADYKIHKDKRDAANRVYRYKNITKSRLNEKKASARFRELNPHKAKETQKRYRSKPNYRLIANSLFRERNSSDELFSIARRIRRLVGISLSRGGYSKKSKTMKIVGCDWPTLKQHIEHQFQPGMSWGNRNLWHIDHIVPVSSAKTEEDIIALNHFTNLRPLWAKENLSKGSESRFLL